MNRPWLSRAVPSLVALVVVGTALSACGSSSSGSGGTSSPAASATTLAGTAWALESFAGSGGSQQPAVTQPSVASLNFSKDGKVSGSTGCNRIAGTYTQSGDALTIALGPMTKMACVGAVMTQEAAVVAAMPKVTSFSTTTGTLELRDSGGAVLLVYKPGLAGLANTAWQATGINNGKAAVEGSAQTRAVTAVFGDKGALTGTGGCNTYTAKYTTSGTDGLTIGAVASTMKACDEAVMTTEHQYFTALAKVTTYQIDGSQLTLRDASGATQVTYILTS